MNPEFLLTHFNRISDAPDAIPRLRLFILDLAVRGKLVEQDPKDEPTSKLIDRIEAQKSRRGLARGNANLLTKLVAADEVPFEIPPNWVWVRLGDLCSKTGSGSTPRGGKSVYQRNGVPFLRSQNVYNGGLRLDDVAYISHQTHEKMSGTSVEPGDLLLNITGGSIGRCCLVQSGLGQANVSQHVAIIRVALDGIQRYLHKLVLSPYFQSFVLSKQTGAGRGGLPKNRMDRIPVTLPSLAEQLRIVAKVDELMALCDRLEAEQSDREARRDRLAATSHYHLNDGADEETLQEHARFYINHLPILTTSAANIHQLRQTTLNLAVKGQLIPQDPNDEPASQILKRIQVEKAGLAKERKFKRELATIEADEIPFSAPLGWEFARIGTFCQLENGDRSKNYPSRHEFVADGIPFINAGHLESGSICLTEMNYIPESRFDLLKSGKVRSGDILFCLRGSLGKSALVTNIPRGAIASSLVIIRLAGEINPHFILNYLFSSLAVGMISRFDNGTAQPNLSSADLAKFICPLPPLAEQHRIVTKVNELMALCNALEVQLSTSQSEASRLLEAVLHRSLAEAS
jgi:type I restriction enzyme S subunit